MAVYLQESYILFTGNNLRRPGTRCKYCGIMYQNRMADARTVS